MEASPAAAPSGRAHRGGRAEVVGAAGQDAVPALHRAPLHRVRAELRVHHLQRPRPARRRHLRAGSSCAGRRDGSGDAAPPRSGTAARLLPGQGRGGPGSSRPAGASAGGAAPARPRRARPLPGLPAAQPGRGARRPKAGLLAQAARDGAELRPSPPSDEGFSFNSSKLLPGGLLAPTTSRGKGSAAQTRVRGRTAARF